MNSMKGSGTVLTAITYLTHQAAGFLLIGIYVRVSSWFAFAAELTETNHEITYVITVETGFTYLTHRLPSYRSNRSYANTDVNLQ